jgi:RNA polymerase sigma factor (sigma-70 family)
MILRNVRTRARSYIHDLGTVDLPDQLDPTVLESLVIKLKSGEPVGPKIIEGHIKLAMAIVGRYYGRTRNSADDLVGAALYGLCQAVEWAPKRLHDHNITPYIVSTIHRHISDHIEQNHLVRIPRETYKNLRETGSVVPLPIDKNRDLDIFIDDEEYEYVDRVTPVHKDDTPQIIIDEIRSSLMLTDFEDKMLDLKLKGFTYREIADRLGSSFQWIDNLFIGLRERAIRRGLRPPQESGGR